MKKKYVKDLTMVILIVIIFIYKLITGDILEKKEVTFNECVDGDTAWLNVDGERKKFRFLAIDTPETVHPTKNVEKYGKNASEYTCYKLKNAKKIEVEYENNAKDKYGRELAWILLDDSLLQKELISIGYAKVAYIYGDYKYTNDLCNIQSIAIEEKLGIWSDSEDIGYCNKNN